MNDPFAPFDKDHVLAAFGCESPSEDVSAINGEGFAWFCWHCLRWPGASSYPHFPCKFKVGYLCADMWSRHER